jgi:hypothetical protein
MYKVITRCMEQGGGGGEIQTTKVNNWELHTLNVNQVLKSIGVFLRLLLPSMVKLSGLRI